MEINSLEDLEKAKSCYKCLKIFDKSEGEMSIPQVFGFIGGIARDIDTASGSDPKLRFICKKCLSRQRLRARLVNLFILGLSLFIVIGMIFEP